MHNVEKWLNMLKKSCGVLCLSHFSILFMKGLISEIIARVVHYQVIHFLTESELIIYA